MPKAVQKGVVPPLRFPEFRDAGPWEVKELHDLAEKITQGGTPKTSVPEYWDGGIPWLTPAEMGDDAAHHYTFQTTRTISTNGLKNSSTELLPINSVIISSRAPIGYVTINKTEMATNQGCKGIVPRENVYHEFIYHSLITSKQRLNDLGAGAGFKEISTSTLKAFQIAIPKKQEQQKIADCLSSLDELIQAEKKALEALKKHKKGLMQQLFPAPDETTPKLRFPEFRDAEPWEVKRLGAVCDFFKGKGLPKSEITPEGKIPCIHYGELFTDYGEVIRNIKSFTNSSGNCVLSKEDDVLMPTSDVTPNGLAKASCIKLSNVILGGDILIIRPHKEMVFGEYLSRFIRFRENEVLRYVSGTTVFHLYPGSISKFQVPLPSITEQQKIADCLSSLDDLILAKSKRIEALRLHKKGLMQQLFPSMDEV